MRYCCQPVCSIAPCAQYADHITLNNISVVQGEAQCCVTGAAFDHMLQLGDRSLLEAVMRNVVVFSRMKSHQKGQVMELLGTKGLHQIVAGQQQHLPVSLLQQSLPTMLSLRAPFPPHTLPPPPTPRPPPRPPPVPFLPPRLLHPLPTSSASFTSHAAMKQAAVALFSGFSRLNLLGYPLLVYSSGVHQGSN